MFIKTTTKPGRVRVTQLTRPLVDVFANVFWREKPQPKPKKENKK